MFQKDHIACLLNRNTSMLYRHVSDVNFRSDNQRGVGVSGAAYKTPNAGVHTVPIALPSCQRTQERKFREDAAKSSKRDDG